MRQLEFQVLETRATDGPAETHDGRFADADAVGKIGHGAMHHGRRIKQYVIGDFQLRLAQQVA
ncbi:hypothetical protein D3C76_1482660 [compost metagenome]